MCRIQKSSREDVLAQETKKLTELKRRKTCWKKIKGTVSWREWLTVLKFAL